MDKFSKLSEMMFVPLNRDCWTSYINENFSAVTEGSIETSIEVISKERDLIAQETGFDEKVKVNRLIPSLKSKLKIKA